MKSLLSYALFGLLLCCLTPPGGAATQPEFRAIRPAIFAATGTTTCVTIPDFYTPSAYDYSILSAYGVDCVRFDLGAANPQQVAASQAEVRAVVAHGLKILLVSPYIPLGAVPSQALFTMDAAITAQTVALSPPAFLYVELMNEANDDGRLDEAQLTPSQYVSYANTISASLLPYHTSTSTSGVTFNNSNYLSWLNATVPHINASCVGAHFYSLSPSFFRSVILALGLRYGKPVCMTEWTPDSYADLSTAFRQSRPYASVFGVYNLQLLEQNAWEAALR